MFLNKLRSGSCSGSSIIFCNTAQNNKETKERNTGNAMKIKVEAHYHAKKIAINNVALVPDLTGCGCKTLLIKAWFQYLMSELRLLTKTRIEVYPLSSQNYAAVLRNGITASSEFKWKYREIFVRVSDPHWFNADPDPGLFCEFNSIVTF